MLPLQKAKLVSQALQLGLLLEVSSKKPGNVNLSSGFKGTKFEHFLASAVASIPFFETAAFRGISVLEGNLEIKNLGVGKIIQNCLEEINVWQKGGNTLLGAIILYVPIAAADGMTRLEDVFDLLKLRANLTKVLQSTTPNDAVHLYEAFDTIKPSGLNNAPDFDLTSPESKNRLLKENIPLYDVFKIAADYDDVCSEWISGYSISSDLAYPYLLEQIKTRDLNTAIIHTFLKVLSKHPDTLITRKVGLKLSQEISSDANYLLQLGGLDTKEGQQELIVFDNKLRKDGNNLNPGTTADLIAATLGFYILTGYRP